MTDDIVERLRKYSSAIFLACHKDVADDISPKLIEAAAEIERLRNNNGNLLLEVADLHIKIGGLNAEIERLRTPRKYKPSFRPRPEAKP